jgi:hypothetical protein
VKWNEVTRLKMKGSLLVVKDAMIMLSQEQSDLEWPSVACTPGEYIVEIHVPDPYTCHRVRIRKSDSTPSLGNAIGTVEIDHGFVGIIDYEPFYQAVTRDYEAYGDWTEANLDDELSINFSGEITFDSEKLVYVKAGEGDGTYTTYGLVQNGDTVGCECVFIE